MSASGSPTPAQVRQGIVHLSDAVRNESVSLRKERVKRVFERDNVFECSQPWFAELLVSIILDLQATEGERASQRFFDDFWNEWDRVDIPRLCYAADHLTFPDVPPQWFIMELIDLLEFSHYQWGQLTMGPGGEFEVRVGNKTWVQMSPEKDRDFQVGQLVAVPTGLFHAHKHRPGVQMTLGFSPLEAKR